MKNYILSLLYREVLEDKLQAKYKEIGGLKVKSVEAFQQEDVNNNLITTVRFCYGFMGSESIVFRYYNDELFTVTGYGVEIKFIDEMKNLLKEYNKWEHK